MSGHTVSYCDVLKSKKEADDVPVKSNRKKESQNGSFFILRVSQDGSEAITHAPATPSTPPRKQQTNQYTARALVNPGRNKFVLLADDEEEEEAEAEVEIAIAIEPTSAQEVTWAKIVSRAPITKKSVTFSDIPPIYKRQINQVINETRVAAAEKPLPTFIHAVTKGTTSVIKEAPIKNLFDTYYRPGRSWADDSSDDEEDGGWAINMCK